MATIEVRKSCSKTSYRARVRVKGYPQITASFARKTDAKRWAAGIEADIHSGRYFPETHHTIGNLSDERKYPRGWALLAILSAHL